MEQKAMSDNDSTAEKRIVGQLSFGAKTSKRAGWAAWEFTITGPHQVEVTNASWGFEKDDHRYTVGIEERDGVPVPAECGCPADQYNDDYDCKHKVALATVGGETVLNAATEFENSAPPLSQSDAESATTAADKLRTDGGIVKASDDGEVLTDEESADKGQERPDDCDCGDWNQGLGLACWPCYREGLEVPNPNAVDTENGLK
jgi:hypothetical protein